MRALVLRTVVVILGVIGLTGCGQMPQTHNEFVNYPRGIEKVTFTVPRGLDTVIQGVNKQADACVHQGARRTGTMSSMSISLKTLTIKKVSATSAEFDYRERSNNTIGEPEGGFYLLAADLVAKGPRSTAVTISHTGYHQDMVAALRKWIEGDTSSCHGYTP